MCVQNMGELAIFITGKLMILCFIWDVSFNYIMN